MVRFMAVQCLFQEYSSYWGFIIFVDFNFRALRFHLFSLVSISWQKRNIFI